MISQTYDDVYDDNAIYDEYGDYMQEEKSSFRGSRFGSFVPPEAASSPRAEDGGGMSSYQFAALSGYDSFISCILHRKIYETLAK